MICSQWTQAGLLTIIFCFSCSWNTCFLVWKSFSLLEEMEIFIVLSALCLPLKKRDHWKCFEKSKRFHKCSLLSKSQMSVISLQTTNSGKESMDTEPHQVCRETQYLSSPPLPAQNTGFLPLWSSAFLTIHFRGGFTGVIFCPAQFYSVCLTFYVVVSTVLCPKPHL